MTQMYDKRYHIIDQYLARFFKYKGECLSSPPLFLDGQIITTFLIQWSPPIRIQSCNFSQLWNPYTLILVLFLEFLLYDNRNNNVTLFVLPLNFFLKSLK